MAEAIILTKDIMNALVDKDRIPDKEHGELGEPSCLLLTRSLSRNCGRDPMENPFGGGG